MASGKHKVFVYGTLKKGQSNEYIMNSLGCCTYIGKAQTLEKYPLIIDTEYNLPLLLNDPSKGKIVQGEIYEVNEEDLQTLDQFESDLYNRCEIDVNLTDSESKESCLKCWSFFVRKHSAEYLEKQCFEVYENNGSQGNTGSQDNNSSQGNAGSQDNNSSQGNAGSQDNNGSQDNSGSQENNGSQDNSGSQDNNGSKDNNDSHGLKFSDLTRADLDNVCSK